MFIESSKILQHLRKETNDWFVSFQGKLFYFNYNSAHLRETIVSIYPKTWCAQAVDTDFQGTTPSLTPLSYTLCKESKCSAVHQTIKYPHAHKRK